MGRIIHELRVSVEIVSDREPRHVAFPSATPFHNHTSLISLARGSQLFLNQTLPETRKGGGDDDETQQSCTEQVGFLRKVRTNGLEHT